MRAFAIRFASVAAALGIIAISAGSATGYPLFRNAVCTGGSNSGAPCAVASECPGGTCGGTDDCFQCHGSFLASPYRSCVGGSNEAAACSADSQCPGGTCAAWSGPLHNVHRNNMLGATPTNPPGRCDICHVGTTKTPVLLNESNGNLACVGGTNAGAYCQVDSACPGGTCSGIVYPPISCIGCHGRAADRGMRPDDCVDAQTTDGPCGDGAGLRQHHQNSGVTLCADCHADAVPANFTTAGENTPPTYYFTPDSAHPLKPTNACNPNGEEDYEASPDGLDNDGDLLYDGADPDCATPTATATATATPAASGTADATATPEATITPEASATPTVTATVTTTPAPTPAPGKDTQKCQAAIVKSAASFVQAKTKALQKCEDGVVKRKVTGPCPDAKAADGIAKAAAKLTSGIAKACGGKDKTCGSGADDVGIESLGWPSVCPDFEDKGCANAIADCGDIADCLACTGEATVDQAIDLYYGALVPTDPKSKDKAEKSLNKCQGTIGKAGAKLLAAQSKALQKCWDGKIKGKVNDCPDLAAGDSVSKAVVKAVGTINGACGGKDKQPGGTGADADFTAAEIGFPVSCTDVTFPGFITPCGAPITDLQSLTSCVACVTRFKAGCADRAGATGLTPYPSECNP